MQPLSFLSIVTLALAVNAFKSSVLQVKHHHHNAIAARANKQCRTGPQRSPSQGGRESMADSPSSVVIAENPPSTIKSAAPASSSVPEAQITAESISSHISSSEPSPGAAEPVVFAKTEAAAVSLTPNNNKAGIAGGDAYPYLKDRIGWWYDWSPNPSKAGNPIAVPMLWGAGTADAQDAARLATFKNLKVAPKYLLGFEEPDCPAGSGSAGMSVDSGVSKWETYIAPMRAKGAKVGSPSMCKQADETWLASFQKKAKTPWDFTAIHINKNNMAGVRKDIEHYAQYGKPIWVTEFACVNDYPNFVPCTNQAEINKFIYDVVDLFEKEPRVYAYAYSNGLGLGNVWPLTTKDGKLSASGQTYLSAISRYH
ncbi:hypothetical protein FA15DRAFT_91132 [Coprinopsis marcescibilis]|uniref:Asl1-like glycosyl hydrolase catalytic domain-containing protein n=1 Tax=Coprinopsis marcescibilis TaxID=230819 RepID=A0A5C3L6A4_COPMA|nr:hypothetical protein FA15DRAFT_91132 [Coprinopsis marcescibilis]